MKQLQKMTPDSIVRGEDYNRLVDAIAQSQNIICGPGIESRRTSAGNCISLVKNKLDRAHAATETEDSGKIVPYFMARITGWQTANSCQYLGVQHIIAWEYRFAQVIKGGEGVLGYWQALPGGWSGTAYNTLEVMNVGPSVNDVYATSGIGISLKSLWDNYPTFDLVPAPIDAIVTMWRVPVNIQDSPTHEFWFQYENSVEGTC